MPRLQEISRKNIHAAAEPLFQMLFGDRDPTKHPGTGTGTPGDWWTVFAGVPDIFDHAVAGFTIYQSEARELDPKLRELGQMRAGYVCASQFVFSQHCKAARDAGIAEEKIQGVPAYSVAGCFSPLELAVMAYTDALALEHGRVAEELFSELKRHLSDAAILELTYIVSLYIMHATMSRALHLEYDNVDERVREIPAPGGEQGLAATFYELED